MSCRRHKVRTFTVHKLGVCLLGCLTLVLPVPCKMMRFSIGLVKSDVPFR